MAQCPPSRHCPPQLISTSPKKKKNSPQHPRLPSPPSPLQHHARQNPPPARSQNILPPPRRKTNLPVPPPPPPLPQPTSDSLFPWKLTNQSKPPLFPRGSQRPNFTLTLLRTPHAPSHFASFLTPLYFNKLDLKDYLWNLYGLEVLGVRSYVIQARVQQDKPGAKMPVQHR